MCEISCKNSERLLRKWQKNFRGYFFLPHTVVYYLGHVKNIYASHDVLTKQLMSVYKPHSGNELLTCGLTEQRAVVVTYVVKFFIILTNQNKPKHFLQSINFWMIREECN